jgi:spermidine synthase
MGQSDAVLERDDFAWLGPANRTLTLFLVSVLGLFLELMLIRWIGTEIRIFAYLQNTVLVVCFMGLGMGCLTCRKPIIVREMLWPLLILTLLLAIPITRSALGSITGMLTVLGDFVIWSNGVSTSPLQTGRAIILGLGLTLCLMIVLWDIFVPLGRIFGRLLADHPRPIWAYSVNVAGGLVGIWLFVLLSAWEQPPWVWFAAAAVLVWVLIAPGGLHRVRIEAGLLVGLILAAWFAGREPGMLAVVWSPYQKLVLGATNSGDSRKKEVPGTYMVTVNNTGYQAMIDLNERTIAADPGRYPPAMQGLSQYDIPFLVHPKPRTALSIGAGSGNDAAGALRHGVERVTAVEIDPAIIAMGRRYHPERPYDSARVHVVNDDARSFFMTCRDRFDVISFGLLDSHTTTSMTNARLDHYVYTKESLERARSLLADGGIVVLSFESQKPFIADRMAHSLREVFGQEPICFRVPGSQFGWGGVLFIAGDLDQARKQIEANPRLAKAIADWQKQEPVVLAGTTSVTTDDWPYLYLETPRIPLLYYLLGGLMVLLFIRGTRQLNLGAMVTRWRRNEWHFFFLGAAFLLLEVQNISKASVVLGNTWFVNAVVISGILVMVLAANLVVARLPRLPEASVYAGLFLICLSLEFIDIARFGFLPMAQKVVLVGAVTSLPMLFSGILFARSFANADQKDQALGANLIGSLAGGLLQSVTFIIGVRALILIVAALYFAAMLCRRRAAAPNPVDSPRTPNLFKSLKRKTAMTPRY